MNILARLDHLIKRYRQLLRHPQSWEGEDLLEFVSIVKSLHAELAHAPPERLEEYQLKVDELDDQLRSTAKANPDIFEVWSRDWTTRVNILKDELGWEL